jgi:hypothetical protein
LEGRISIPTIVVVTTGNQTVNLSWSAIPGAIGYDVYRNNALVSNGGSQYPTTTGTSYTDALSFDYGAAPEGLESGPAGMGAGAMWALTHQLTGATPTVGVGLGLGSSTATTASAGSKTLPANPVGFLEISLNGTIYKIPYYAT